MDSLSFKKSQLYREFKKVKIARSRKAELDFDNVNSKLSEAIGEDNFKLIPFHDGIRFKYSLLHDSRSILNKLNCKSVELKLCSAEMGGFLIDIGKSIHHKYILMYTNYSEELPFIFTTIDMFSENHKLFLDLLENEVSILFDDSSNYIQIDQQMEDVNIILRGNELVK